MDDTKKKFVIGVDNFNTIFLSEEPALDSRGKVIQNVIMDCLDDVAEYAKNFCKSIDVPNLKTGELAYTITVKHY